MLPRVEDLLARVRPKEWVEKGAPDAYLQQLQSSKTSMQLLIAATEKVAKDPEKLSASWMRCFGWTAWICFCSRSKTA